MSSRSRAGSLTLFARRVLRLGFPDAGWSSPVARWAHNPKVAGSNPAPATILIRGLRPRTPYTLSRSPLRRLAPFVCAASRRSPRLLSRNFLIRGLRPRTPYTVTRSALRRLAPFRWRARSRSRCPSCPCFAPGPLTHSLARRFAGSLRSCARLRVARRDCSVATSLHARTPTHALAVPAVAQSREGGVEESEGPNVMGPNPCKLARLSQNWDKLEGCDVSWLPTRNRWIGSGRPSAIS